MNGLYKLIPLFLTLLLAAALPAQEAQQKEVYSDVLYLKNGSVLKGKLLEYLPGVRVDFEMSTGSRLTFPYKEVKRVVQNAGAGEKMKAKPVREYAFRERGLYGSVLGGTATGRDFWGDNAVAFGAQGVVGYQFSRWLGAGLGLGVDAYQPSRSEIVYPVFAEARGYFSPRKISGYYAARVGYGIVGGEDEELLVETGGGLFFNPALGIRWGGGPGINFVSEVGYQYQSARFTWSRGVREGRDSFHQEYQRLTLRLGLVF